MRAYTGVRIRHIEHMAQPVRGIPVYKKRNTLCAFVDPSAEPVPCLNLSAGGRVRLLCVYE